MINTAHLSLNVGIELQEINMLTLEIFIIPLIFKIVFLLNILLFYFVPKLQEDYFFNYTDFFVNYDESQYIPNVLIQLIFFFIIYHNFSIMLYKLHIFSKLNINSCKTVIKKYPSNDIQKSCLI